MERRLEELEKILLGAEKYRRKWGWGKGCRAVRVAVEHSDGTVAQESDVREMRMRENWFYRLRIIENIGSLKLNVMCVCHTFRYPCVPVY